LKGISSEKNPFKINPFRKKSHQEKIPSGKNPLRKKFLQEKIPSKINFF